MATDDRILCVVGFEGSWDHGWGFNDLMENPSFWGSGRPLGALEPSRKVGVAPHLSGWF